MIIVKSVCESQKAHLQPSVLVETFHNTIELQTFTEITCEEVSICCASFCIK